MSNRKAENSQRHDKSFYEELARKMKESSKEKASPSNTEPFTICVFQTEQDEQEKP